MEGWTSILSIHAANNTIVGNYFARAYFSDGSSKDSATVSVSIASMWVLRLGWKRGSEFYTDEEEKSAKCGRFIVYSKRETIRRRDWELSGLIISEYTLPFGSENTSAAWLQNFSTASAVWPNTLSPLL